MTDLEPFRIFQTVYALRSYSQASVRLRLSVATVRDRIRRLSDRLGEALFLHAPEGLTPTEAAHRLNQTTQFMAAALGAFERAASAPAASLAGRVRIAIGQESAAALVLLRPVLARLLADHPGLGLDLGQEVDWELAAMGAGDVVYRHGGPPDDRFLGEAVGRVRVSWYAHVSYLARTGLDADERDISRFDLITPRPPTPVMREYPDFFAGVRTAAMAMTSNDRGAQMRAFRAGGGALFLPDFVAQQEPGTVRVLTDRVGELSAWVGARREASDYARVRLVRDALMEECRRVLPQ